eukprot:537993-Rhodomonas_salina.2
MRGRGVSSFRSEGWGEGERESAADTQWLVLFQVPKRNLNLHEYQSSMIMAKHGVRPLLFSPPRLPRFFPS